MALDLFDGDDQIHISRLLGRNRVFVLLRPERAGGSNSLAGSICEAQAPYAP